MPTSTTDDQQSATFASGYGGPRRQASLLALLLVNLLPLGGVLFLQWDVCALVILYWTENLVLGVYTLARMFVVSPLGALPMGAFFSIHYGGFCAVHGLFLVTLVLGRDFNPMEGDAWPFFLVFIQLLVNVVREVLSAAPPAWLWAFGALFVSHGISFVANFLFGGERDRLELKALMAAPYGRIMILHVAIILGGFAVMALGEPLAMLVILVLLKMAIDVALHVREHRRLAGA